MTINSLLRNYAKKYNILVDLPDRSRKFHKRPTPLTGGIGILIAILVSGKLYIDLNNLTGYLPEFTFQLVVISIPLILFLEINRPFYVFILIIIGGLTDYFDGLIARKFNLKTRLGAILDPLSDKVFYLIPLTFLCKNNFIPFWSLSLILFRELIISSLRNSTKDGLPASMLGKFKTFFFFISVITFFTPLKISLLNNLALIFYWLGFILTFVTLLGYLRIKKNII